MPGNDTVDEERAYLARRLVEFKYDPLGYVIWAFPWGKPGTELAGMTGPRTWQVAVLKRIGELLRARRLDPQGAIQIARASGHGIGKSALLAMLTMWALSTMVGHEGRHHSEYREAAPHEDVAGAGEVASAGAQRIDVRVHGDIAVCERPGALAHVARGSHPVV
jgi:hypothetical protein